MNLRHLQTLATVLDTGSFQAAAERLHITQSAVSMQIKALESELGAALFDRTVRPPAPTVAGRATAARARAVLAEAEALRAAAGDPDALAGTLNLGTIPTAATDFLPNALAALAARHDKLRARVESGLSDTLCTRVALGELDAAVVTESDDAIGGLSLLPIREEPLVVAAAHAFDPSKVNTMLKAHPFIRFNRATGVGRIIDRTLRSEGIPVHDAMELDSIEAILMMVSRGLGIAIVPETSVRGDLAHGLHTAPFGRPPLTRTVGLALRQGGRDDPALGALYEILCEAARQ